LAAAGSPSARLDAELLLGKATGWSRAELLAHPERVVSGEQGGTFRALVARRGAMEPIAYLLGEREFYGRSFMVDRRALIPRPETELLVDLGRAAVAHWRGRGVEPTVVEVGTGSGAVAISVALESSVKVIATDVSAEALSLAAENASFVRREALGPATEGPYRHSARVSFVQTDLLGAFGGPLHVVLANLPYVPLGRALPRDVRDYEPPVALFGGERGTELVERLLREAQPLLVRGSELAVELDEADQAAPVAAVAARLYPSAEVTTHQDAGGYDRVIRVVVLQGARVTLA
jgi:release factor glutamine methyltransferase